MLLHLSLLIQASPVEAVVTLMVAVPTVVAADPRVEAVAPAEAGVAVAAQVVTNHCYCTPARSFTTKYKTACH